MYLQTIALLSCIFYADGIKSCPSIQGVYPSLDSCLTYTRCFIGQPFIFYCRNGDVYDNSIKSCGKSKCHTFVCTSAKYALYSGDSSIYALCNKGIASDIKQCPQGQSFDISKEICTFQCPKIGIFPDLSDCTSYIECSFLGIMYKKCPVNSWFDPSKMMCTSSQTEKCKSFQSLTTTTDNWKKKKKRIQTNPTTLTSTSEFLTYETTSDYESSTILDTLENTEPEELYDQILMDYEIKSTYEEVASCSSILNTLPFNILLTVIIIVNLVTN